MQWGERKWRESESHGPPGMHGHRNTSQLPQPMCACACEHVVTCRAARSPFPLFAHTQSTQTHTCTWDMRSNQVRTLRRSAHKQRRDEASAATSCEIS